MGKVPKVYIDIIRPCRDLNKVYLYVGHMRVHCVRARGGARHVERD